MSNNLQTAKNAAWLMGAAVHTPQTVCPIAKGMCGDWLDANTTPATPRYRLASGLDVSRSSVGNVTNVAQAGIVPAARLVFSANPANTNPMQIGIATFQFLTPLTAATTYTQIKRGASAAATLASTLNAINGVADATVVPGSTLAAQMAAVPLVADAVTATALRIRKADAIGGNPVAGTVASTALTATITAGASAWSVADLNATGKNSGDALITSGSVTITAAMIANGGVNVELPFTPTIVSPDFYSAAGVPLATTDSVTISGASILVSLAGGGAPALVATNVVSFVATK